MVGEDLTLSWDGNVFMRDKAIEHSVAKYFNPSQMFTSEQLDKVNCARAATHSFEIVSRHRVKKQVK